jgi:hypothetical protein
MGKIKWSCRRDGEKDRKQCRVECQNVNTAKLHGDKVIYRYKKYT